MTGSLPLAAADQVNDFEVSRQQQRQSFEGLARSMPLIPARNIREVLRIRLENRSLVLDTPVHGTPNGEFAQVRLEGLPGTKLISVQRSNDSIAQQGLSYHLNITDYATPRQITNLVVALEAGRLNISKSTQFSDGGFHSVMILQQQRAELSFGATVLQVVVNDARSSGAAPAQKTFESADFFTFLREHSREADQYVRPLISELGQETLFGPEPLVVWQVFADLWKPDPQAVSRVTELLPRLDDPSYKVRERAQAALQHLGREGAAVMLHLDRGRLTAEQNVRIDRALLPYAQLPPREAGRLRSDAGFLLDCLYSDDATLRQAALSRLRETLKQDVQVDPNAPSTVRAQTIARLRQQLLAPRNPK